MPSWTWGVYLEELPVSCAGGQGCVDGCDGLHDQDVQAEGRARTAQYEGGDGESFDTECLNQNIQVVISDWDKMEERGESNVEYGEDGMSRGESEES